MSAIAVVFAAASPAFGELQNVEVGGRIVVLGEYYRNEITAGDGLRWLGTQFYGRAIGTPANDIYTWFAGDDHGPGWSYVTQWTRLHTCADFTDRVLAFIELDSVDTWGEDFRSNYTTGVDGRAGTFDDIEIYQSYIEVSELFGWPLRARIGRQELVLGSEWLVGNDDYGAAPLYGLSFDALRLTYAGDSFTVDAWWSKLAERSPLEEDADADFSGVYASFAGIENITLDAYWLWLRDAAAVQDTRLSPLGEWIEDRLGLDDYDGLDIHTVGLRGAGEIGAFDFEAEVSYQWGDAAPVGTLFRAFNYGDDGAAYDAWGANVDVGYTFDVAWQPRFYLGYTYLGGEDNRDVGFGDWLETFVNPFYRGGSSVSFNRLFSDKYLSITLDGTDMSNLHAFRGGVSATPTEKVGIGLDVTYLLADEAFDVPVHMDLGHFFNNYRFRLPLASALSFWTDSNDKDLGWETVLYADYSYSDDLTFSAGWGHLFAGDGLEDGQFIGSNGLDFIGASNNDDVDYFYFGMAIEFGGAPEE
jgi:hypothetical protein